MATCHIPGVPLEPGLGLSVDLDTPGLPIGVQREFSLSAGAVLLLPIMTENCG